MFQIQKLLQIEMSKAAVPHLHSAMPRLIRKALEQISPFCVRERPRKVPLPSSWPCLPFGGKNQTVD